MVYVWSEWFRIGPIGVPYSFSGWAGWMVGKEATDEGNLTSNHYGSELCGYHESIRAASW